MISAGKTIKDFSVSAACTSNEQCGEIIDKLTKACGVVNSELVVDPATVQDKYADVIGVVYKDKDGKSTAPADGDYDNFSNVCIDHFLNIPTSPGLPGASMAGYADLYSAGDDDVTAADIATLNALMSKKDKTPEQCAEDDKIPDGKGECKACPDDTEFKGVAEGCVKEKEGPRILFLQLEAAGGGAVMNTESGEDTSDTIITGKGAIGVAVRLNDGKHQWFWGPTANVFGSMFEPNEDEGIGYTYLTTWALDVIRFEVDINLQGAHYLILRAGLPMGVTTGKVTSEELGPKELKAGDTFGVFFNPALLYKHDFGEGAPELIAGLEFMGRIPFINPLDFGCPNCEEGENGGVYKVSAYLWFVLGARF